jgi:hypothetical protein
VETFSIKFSNTSRTATITAACLDLVKAKFYLFTEPNFSGYLPEYQISKLTNEILGTDQQVFIGFAGLNGAATACNEISYTTQNFKVKICKTHLLVSLDFGGGSTESVEL